MWSVERVKKMSVPKNLFNWKFLLKLNEKFWAKTTFRHLPDTILTSSRHLPNIFLNISRNIPCTFQTPSVRLSNTFQTLSSLQAPSRNLPDTLKTPPRQFQNPYILSNLSAGVNILHMGSHQKKIPNFGHCPNMGGGHWRSQKKILKKVWTCN